MFFNQLADLNIFNYDMNMNSYDNINKMANLKIATLNINGMSKLSKQEILVDFIQKEDIQCCLIQEHNLKCQNSLYDVICDRYDIFFLMHL